MPHVKRQKIEIKLQVIITAILLFAGFFVFSNKAQAVVGFQVGTSTLILNDGENLMYGNINASSNAGSNLLLLQNAGTPKFLITSAGNVGIGVSSANDIFSIGDAGSSAPLGSANTGHNYTSTYSSDDNYALTNYGLVKSLIASATSSSALWGGTLGGAIWNLNSGNVGIGLTNPTSKLSVGGDIRLTNLNKIFLSDNFTVQSLLSAGTSYRRGFIGANLYWDDANSVWQSPSAGGQDISGIFFNNGGSMYFVSAGGIVQPTTLTNAQISSYARMIIAPTGNVGIGTTNPLSLLHVNGNAQFGQNIDNSTSTPLKVSFGGTYGNNTPGTTGNLKWLMYDGGGVIKYGIGMSMNLMEFQAGNGGFAFYPNSSSVQTAALRIATNGSVGIGTTDTTSGAKLTVAGDFWTGWGVTNGYSYNDIGASRTVDKAMRIWFNNDSDYGGFHIWGDAAGSSLVIKKGGNVGIGTISPNDNFSIGNGGTAAPVGSSNTGHNYTSTYSSSDNYALTNYGLVKSLIAAATSSSALWGGTMGGAIWNLNSGNVGIGVTNPGSALDINGIVRASSTSAGFGYQPLASSLYVQSRGENLTTNGSGLMGNNYNFSTLTFDPAETHGGGGSFRVNVATASRFSDELIPVDISKRYRQVVWVKSGDVDGGNYNSGNRQYIGVANYDIDGFPIGAENSAKYPGSTDTTLAAQLNPGDTTVTLTDATGWYNSTVPSSRQFSWYGYTNSKGYTYPDYTYTRYVSGNYSSNSSLGTWNSGGISGNVITLRVPWAGPTIPAGTAVRNGQYGGTYKYITLLNGIVPNTWTRYEGYIGAPAGDAIERNNEFRAGTAYIKWLFLINYHGAADNNVRYSDMWFSEASSQNLEVASATQQGVISLTNQTLGAGNKFFSGNVGIGTTAPLDSFSIGNSGTAPAGSANTGHNYTSTYTSSDNYALTNYGLVKSLISAATSSSALWGGTTGGAIWNLNSGNVGIGTTNPTSKLDVNGSAQINSTFRFTTSGTMDWGSGYNSGVLTWDTGYAAVLAKSGNILRLGANGNYSQMVINTSGNVGIGTTNPIMGKLQITGGSSFSAIPANTTALGRIAQTGWDGQGFVFSNSANDAFSMVYGGNNAYFGRITGSAVTHWFRASDIGVSIGGSSVAVNKLDVLGSVAVGSYSGTLAPTNGLIVSGNVGIGTTAPLDIFSIGSGGVAAPAGSANTGHNYTSTYSSDDDYALTNYGLVKSLISAATSSSALWGGTMGGAIWNLNSGNVGIGTSTPGAKLHVSGGSVLIDNNYGYYIKRAADGNGIASMTINSSDLTVYNGAHSTAASLLFQWRNSGTTPLMTITGQGNVGIGTTNPSVRLEVVAPVGGIPLRISRSSNTVNYGSILEFALLNSDSYFTPYADIYGGITTTTTGLEDGFLQFRVKNAGTITNALRIDKNGNVGIGTTAPASALQVHRDTVSAISTIESRDVSAWLRLSRGGVGTNGAIAFQTAGSDKFNIGLANDATNNFYIGDSSFTNKWLTILSSGNVGIGTTAPLDIFSIGSGGVAAPAGSANTGHNYTSTYSSDDDYALTNYGLVKSLISTATSTMSTTTLVSSIFLTTATSTGGLTYSGGYTGYDAGNKICNAAQAGSHFCRTDEIIYLIQINGAAGFSSINGQDAWIADGPPGYTGATSADDCGGWTDGTSNKLGHFWIFASAGGGRGSLSSCDTIKKITCCK